MIDLTTVFTILHIIGVAIGAGGAFASDAIFIQSARDKKITMSEVGFMKIGSIMVWIGLAILIISGIGIFSTDTERFLHSSKFLAKMSIVLFILINGLIFHISHIPTIIEHAKKTISIGRFKSKKPYLMISGAVSLTSWVSALVLGSIRNIGLNYAEIMAVYLSVILVAILFGLALQNKIIPSKKHPDSWV